MPRSATDLSELVELSGHIVDSLLLPKVLDIITSEGAEYELRTVAIGHNRHDASSALIEIIADNQARLDRVLALVSDHGAVPVDSCDCQCQLADIAGAFPEGFYSTTNQRTEVRIAGNWLPVSEQEMDCGIAVDTQQQTARCVPMSEVALGTPIVVGHAGVRVFPEERASTAQGFAFMNSSVSTEKPKGVLIQQVARQMFETHCSGAKTLLVGGPAIVHTGSGPLVCELIRRGYISKLFAGNALATHDLEQAMFGTSLGVHLADASLAEAGHEHHLRAINRIRRAGSIARAVETGLVTSGIMHDCVRHGVEFLLAGSIRDDGPLPDVVTDALEAQRQMRAAVRDIAFCLTVATTLHSIAVGNLLPAWVKMVCVDINPSTVIKLADRGSFQTVGVVTDVEPFFRSLVAELDQLEKLS
jgi:lysine-ketoglutarate reductase/saccharopine dehydrogenase-like protein (TIGR00300 family)